MTGLVGVDIAVPIDVIRHLYVLGVITWLVMGVCGENSPRLSTEVLGCESGIGHGNLLVGQCRRCDPSILVGVPTG